MFDLESLIATEVRMLQENYPIALAHKPRKHPVIQNEAMTNN